MGTRLSRAPWVRRLAAVVFLVVALGFAHAGSPGAQAASSGIKYDELTSFQQSPPSPQPTGFSDRFQAAINAMRPTHHGLFSGILNAGQMMSAMTKTGTPSTKYYYGQWMRTDDPVKQTATIYRPDRHQIIHLDLAKKTYTIEDMGGQSMQTPEPAAPEPQGTPAPSQPGTGKLDISDSAQTLSAMTLDNVATSGYSQDFKMVSSQSTGSCRDGTIEATMVQYLSNYTESRATSAGAIFHFSTTKPEMMAAQGGCQPKIAYHHSGSVNVPSDRLAMWSLITFKSGANSGRPGSFSTLTERGDVQVLGPGDAGLFDVPAGFTKES